MYRVMGEIEHVLERSDMYVGGNTVDTVDAFVADHSGIHYRPVRHTAILQTLFNEVLSNAVDNHCRGYGTTCIKVKFTPDRVVVWNNGRSVPFDDLNGVPTPTAVFGQLRSGSNFDDSEKRQTGGRNGYGVKLVNIWSTAFKITIVNGGKKFCQRFSDNMRKVHKHRITDASGAKDSVCVEYTPDFNRLSVENFTSDDIALMAKRALDAVLCYGIDVRVNGKRVFKTPLQYLKSLCTTPPLVSEGKVWTVAVYPNEQEDFQHMSFCNGISTSDGGTHVSHVVRTLTKILSTGLQKVKLKPVPKLIKDSLFVVLTLRTSNPLFDSQCKTKLKSKKTSFPCLWSPSDLFARKLLKGPIFHRLQEVFSARQELSMKKDDGRKTRRVNVEKLIDASAAGTKDSQLCTLVVCEGLSARAMLLQGTTGNRLQRTVGLLPMKGKVLNCSSASNAKVSANVEIQDLKKTLGLKHKKHYTNTDDLRYGRVLVATDADDDGMHILGLLLTMFQHLYPGLIELGYVQRLVTPLLTARRGKIVKEFFTMLAYNAWKEKEPNFKHYTIKFYKGLGTSTNKDAKRYFADLTRYVHPIKNIPAGSDALRMFFQKSRIEERKEYVRAPKHSSEGQRTLHRFVYDELHGYARASIVRAIPGHDGLKQSARKIIYTCLKKNLYGAANDIKVSELAGIVSKETHYHHGGASLEAAIIILARRFKTVNAVPLLCNEGQFGSYISGGKDHASSRYVFTRLEEVCKLLFHKDDLRVLPKTIVDGKEAEPLLLAPLLPIHLLNGSKGIATGFATQIYSYSATDLIDAALRVLDNKEAVRLVPTFRDWDGECNLHDTFFTTHATTTVQNGKMTVRDLPIGIFPDDFVKALKERKHSVEYTTTGPVYTLHGVEECPKSTQKHSLNNMHALNADGVIVKYASPNALLADYMNFKLDVMNSRLSWQMQSLQSRIAVSRATQTFISHVLDGSLRFRGASDAQLSASLHAIGIGEFAERLLLLPMKRLTQCEITRASAAVLKMETELKKLKDTNPKLQYACELRLLKAHLLTSKKRKRS